MKKETAQTGQALFEMLLFFPFMLILYSVIMSMGGAINGSINQQKVARAYFYSQVKNNSHIPAASDLDNLSISSHVGAFFIGWREYSDGLVPVAPCYKVSPFVRASTSEDCDQSREQSTTSFIRVKTAYGVCSATYSLQEGTFVAAHGFMPVSLRSSCELR